MAIFNQEAILELTREKKEWQNKNVTKKSQANLEKEIANKSTKTLQRNMSEIKRQTFDDKFDNPPGSTEKTIRTEDDKTIQDRVSSNSYKGSIIGKELQKRDAFQGHLHYGYKERKDPEKRKVQTKIEQDYADQHARKRPNNLDESALEILNEVYFGKAPIQSMKAQLTKLRKKLKGKPITSTINLDAEILKFNRIVEKTFGFYNFALYLNHDPIPNAYTFGVETFYTTEEKEKIRKSILANPEGFKFDRKEAKVSMIAAMTSGMLDSEKITDDQIVAVLLHEIGHSYFEAVVLTDNGLDSARNLLDCLSFIHDKAMYIVTNGKEVTEKQIEKDLSQAKKIIDPVVKKIKEIFVKKAHTLRESMTDNISKRYLQYTNEKFADSFAASYGYGPELHDFLTKAYEDIYRDINGVKQYSHIEEILKVYRLYFLDLLAYGLHLQDEHPGELARLNVTLQYLKREVAKETIDPNMKRALLINIQKCESLMEDYMNYPKDQDSMRILRLYHIKLYEKFGGDRREKDTDNEALFAQIDKRYEELKAGK